MADALDPPPVTELAAWQEVHATLIQAVRKAQAAVAQQTAQRRYWMEELCTNLSDNGKLNQCSVWKQAVVLKDPKKKSTNKAGGNKRKTASSDADNGSKKPKRARKKKSLSEEDSTPRSSPDAAELSERSDRSYNTQHDHQQQQQQQQQPPYSHEYHHPHYHPQQHPQQAHHWGAPPPHPSSTAAQANLQMMAAVAFGSAPSYPQGPPPPSQHMPPYSWGHGQQQQQHAQAFHQPRNYSSLQDIASDEDDSDQDRF